MCAVGQRECIDLGAADETVDLRIFKVGIQDLSVQFEGGRKSRLSDQQKLSIGIISITKFTERHKKALNPMCREE